MYWVRIWYGSWSYKVLIISNTAWQQKSCKKKICVETLYFTLFFRPPFFWGLVFHCFLFKTRLLTRISISLMLLSTPFSSLSKSSLLYFPFGLLCHYFLQFSTSSPSKGRVERVCLFGVICFLLLFHTWFFIHGLDRNSGHNITRITWHNPMSSLGFFISEIIPVPSSLPS